MSPEFGNSRLTDVESLDDAQATDLSCRRGATPNKVASADARAAVRLSAKLKSVLDIEPALGFKRPVPFVKTLLVV